MIENLYAKVMYCPESGEAIKIVNTNRGYKMPAELVLSFDTAEEKEEWFAILNKTISACVEAREARLSTVRTLSRKNRKVCHPFINVFPVLP